MSLFRPSRRAPRRLGVHLALTTLLMIGAAAHAQQGDGTEVGFPINIFKPAKVPATPERIAGLKAPPGFKVAAFATDLKNARVLTVAPDGTIYLSRRDQGDVLMLKMGVDGKLAGAPVSVANRAGAHGMAIKDGKFYLVTVKELFVADMLPDGRLGPLTLLVGDLPDAGQHANRTIAFGPEGMLYLSVGSTCNDCNENNPENATILRLTPDGKSRTILASGLRNTIGFGWHPVTGEMWGMDHGIDFLGDEVQAEELNKIEQGKMYGWPHVYGAGDIYPQSTPVGDLSKATWKRISTPMVVGYKAHAAPMQMVFYNGGMFPKRFDGDAFVTMRGSWNRNPAAGYEIVHVHFNGSGVAQGIEPFVSGFLTDGGKTHMARPMGLAIAKDGSLLMADDANGVIYRVSYEGSGMRQDVSHLTVPSGPMQAQVMKGNGMPMALDRPELKGGTALAVSSTFTDGGMLDRRFSKYHDDVSPMLKWPAVAGAKSYLLIVEDPDSKPVAPVVHWLAWNIPAATTQLDEGLQKQLRLTEPDGVLQGRNVAGSYGYTGPRPPVGDPPHHYHFEVLALDTMLDVLPGADRELVLVAAQGHVLAKGRIVGQYAQDRPPLK